jgi:hypothetical protein
MFKISVETVCACSEIKRKLQNIQVKVVSCGNVSYFVRVEIIM